MLLNYAGVILYELWALDAARALFLAAQRLDPELPHLERNLKEVSNRNRSGAHRKLAFHPALADLTKRAKRVASRAKPAEGMRLSLCMIVRDEEEMLPRTLEAAKPAVDEIIIVDTGSQDSTIEIAKVVRGDRDRAGVDGLVQRRSQRLAGRGHRRLVHLPGRR